MFLITAEKTNDTMCDMFLNPDFCFPLLRTPVSRVEKGVRVKESGYKVRTVRHSHFILISGDELEKKMPDDPLVYSTVASLLSQVCADK
jgi:hypothetical protein